MLAGLSAAWAADTVQDFLTKDNRVIRGVVVRRDTKRVMLCTATGVVEVDFRELKSVGLMVHSADELDQILTGFEESYQKRDYAFIERNIPFYQKSLADFTAQVQPDIRSSLVKLEDQQSLQAALDYFNAQLAQVETCRAATKVVDRIKEQYGVLLAGNLAPQAESLDKLIVLAKDYRELTRPTVPGVVQELADAGVLLKRAILNISGALRRSAVDTLKQNQDLRPTEDLVRRLVRGQEEAPTLADELLNLITQVTQVAAAYRAGLPAKVDADVTSTRAGDIVIKGEALPDLTAVLAGWTQTFAKLKDEVGGKPAADCRKQLSDGAADNQKAVAQATARLTQVQQCATLVQQALQLNAARQPVATQTAVQAAKAAFTALKLPLPGVAEALERQAVQAQGRLLYEALRSPANRSLPELEQLTNQGTAFVRQHAAVLPAIGSSVEEFRTIHEQVVNYRDFLTRFQPLSQNLDDDPMASWLLLQQLQAWLDAHTATVSPLAHQQWDQFLLAHGGPCFDAAVRAFLARPAPLQTDNDRALLASFLAHYGERKQEQVALSLLNPLIATVRAADPLSPQLPPLLRHKLDLAVALAERGQMEPALAVVAEIEASDMPYAQLQADTVAGIYERKIRTLLAAGQNAAATELTKPVCDRYPAYAEKHQLYAVLLGKQVEALPQSDPLAPDILAYFNTQCAAYSGHLRGQLKALTRLEADIFARFDEQMRSAHEVDALKGILQLNHDYPALGQELQLVEQTVKRVQRIFRALAMETADESRGTRRALPPAFLENMKVMFQGEWQKPSQTLKLDDLYVDLLLRQARDRAELGQYKQSDRLYKRVEGEFPRLAQERKVSELRSEEAWERWNADVLSPAGLHDAWDWVALGVWVLLWLYLAVDTLRAGLKRGYLRYRLIHLGIGFGTFVILLGVALYANLGGHEEGAHGGSQLWAAVAAFAVPTLVFNLLGNFSYAYFPLIYTERRLGLERWLLRRRKQPKPGVKGLAKQQAKPGWLARDVARMERDMPLLHDRRLLALERAITISAQRPDKGYAAFRNLQRRLDQEILKDEQWRALHFACMLNMALVGVRHGKEEESIAQLRKYLAYDAKHLKAQELVANYLYEHREYDAAVPHLKVCLAGAAQDDDLWFKLGRCFFETDRAVAAHKCFAAISHPSRDGLFYGARAYARSGDYRRAVDWFQRMLRDQPQDAEATCYLAATLAKQGEAVKALKVLALVTPDNPFFPQAQTIKGNLLLRHGKLDHAREALVESLQKDPDNRLALLGLGQLLLARNLNAEAMPIFRKLLHSAPRHPAANYFMGLLLEDDEHAAAIDHFTHALANPELTVRAARRLGRLYFIREDFARAVENFERAAQRDSNEVAAPGFTYLHVFALVRTGAYARAEELLNALLQNAPTDSEWEGQEMGAMYTLGMALVEVGRYPAAVLCLERAQQMAVIHAQQRHIQEWVEEARFRSVISLIAVGDHFGAQNVLNELQAAEQTPARLAACVYYYALSQLLQHDYAGAQKLLEVLHEQAPAEPRLAYHLAVAELGAGRTDAALERATALAAAGQLPDHLRLGVVSMTALVKAQKGNFSEAESLLAKAPPMPAGAPGAEDVLREVALMRCLYLCHLRDPARLALLNGKLPDGARAQAAAWQAAAKLAGDSLLPILQQLRPLAATSETTHKLFAGLALQQAAKYLEQALAEEALQVLALIPHPPSALADLQHWLMASRLTAPAATDLAAIASTVTSLQDLLAKATDPLLRHVLVHNLLWCNLLRAVAVEETSDKENTDVIWQECVQIWQRQLFGDADYWRLAQSRLAGGNPGQDAFTSHEIEVINQRLREDWLLRVWRGYLGGYLKLADFANTKRHLAMIHTLGEEDGHLAPYMTTVGDEVEQVLRRVDRSDEVWNSWDTTITAMALQLEIRELAGGDITDLQRSLEQIKRCRDQYPTPADFAKVRRQFTTQLLEALHTGIRGDLEMAGEQLNALLTSVPPGVSLGDNERTLRLIREYCFKPEEAAEKGLRLEREFERMYQKVRNFDFVRGVSDANSAR